MCTNYVPTRNDRLREHFGVVAPDDDFREEAYPGYMAPIVRLAAADLPVRACAAACFGLIPPWSRDGRNFRQCYNARSETVAAKPSFRNAWRRAQFCIVPADAFFEPNYEPNPTGRPVRWRIGNADGTPMGIAGLWETWRAPDARQVLSFTMLTINADAHPLMRRFHAPGDEKRSVVILPPGDYDRWLAADTAQAATMLIEYPAQRMHALPDPRAPAQRARPPVARPRQAS